MHQYDWKYDNWYKYCTIIQIDTNTGVKGVMQVAQISGDRSNLLRMIGFQNGIIYLYTSKAVGAISFQS